MRLIRSLAAEAFGTALLLCAIVGSGIFAQNHTSDAGVRVLINAISIAFALGVLIWWFAPISGAHFNPVVTAAAVLARGLPAATGFAYALAQLLGAFVGAVASNAMFGLSAIQISTQSRASTGNFVSEVLATACLVAIIKALGVRGQSVLAPVAIGAWILAAIFFTSSTTFANPAVTFGRVFSDTMTGISPASAAVFVLAQVVGLPVGILLAKLFSKENK